MRFHHGFPSGKFRLGTSSKNPLLSTIRDAVLTKKVWERTQKLAILKQLQTHFKANLEKGVGRPFPPHDTPINHGKAHDCTNLCRLCAI